MVSSYNEQLIKLRAEFEKLQKTHAERLEILREENDSIRETIDEKNLFIEKLQTFKKDSEKFNKECRSKELEYKTQITSALEEIGRLKDDNLKLLSFATEGKENKLQVR